ncbi:leucine-rich repeat-containing protein 69 [Boleophthalmus pectinirostris]|uniref:leucine-rich repeat-containing protein 69 n=1 Tax=Boleophthalmus pectinirostris TaxID=150288 RepID=UPI00242BB69C|nr:leucine-rich repeat-containing protein 69 [Boleophthalmus pectinirostris]
MAECVVRACYARATSLKMSSRNLKEVPSDICMLPQLSVLLLNNNHICTLPVEMLRLPHLTELNLGNNTFKEIPAVVGHLERLKKLYLYSNHISAVSSEVIGSLKNLCVLNLNHNHIQRLPSEINSLTKLQCLSLAHNRLEDIPSELGHLTELTEVNFTDNCLSQLPHEIYHCKLLTKIYLAKNQLNRLPEGIRVLTKLQVLDVAGNKLAMFPAEFHHLHLTELYFEGNKLVQCNPIPSVLGQEMLSLKELVARFVLHEDRNKSSLVHKTLPYYPNLITLLAKGSYCSLCLKPILTTWLECVHFVNLRKVMKMKKSLTVPVRALLCSYRCFSTGGHTYYSVVST